MINDVDIPIVVVQRVLPALANIALVVVEDAPLRNRVVCEEGHFVVTEHAA